MLRYEKEYNQLCERVIQEGYPIYNERTGKICHTVINNDFVYNVGAGEVPILTNKQVFVQSAIAEIIGYLRGYTCAQKFKNIGSPSWIMNSNKTKQWLINPNRKGENDCGLIYGAVAKDWHGVDLIQKVYNNLSKGIDDRREIVTFFDPSKFDKACLRPCAYEWIWSLVGGKLSLTVTQASCDVPLGLPWNSVSFYFLLKLMAKITGNEPDKVYHKLINVHIYDDQIEPLKEQLSRTPLDIKPILEIAAWVETLEDVIGCDKHAREYFTLAGYNHQGKIEFPFSV